MLSLLKHVSSSLVGVNPSSPERNEGRIDTKGRNCIIFTKIGTKLRQKLEYRNQIENEEMTRDIILTHGIITATSLCHCHVARRQLDMWQICYFLKEIQKIQKIQEWTRDTLFNAINVPLMKMTKLKSNIPKQGPNLDEKK